MSSHLATEVPDGAQQRAHARRWWVLVVLSLSMFMVVVDNLIVNVALPTLQRDLNASTTALQWIVDSYSLVFAGLLLAGGGIGDRFGRKGAMQIGLVLFAVCSTLGAFAGSTNELIFWRGAMGIGASLVFPATLAIITNLFVDPVERAKAIGIWSAVSGMAVAFGPIVGGVLLKHYWWGSVFLINIPVVLVALVAGAFVIPTSRDPHANRLDIAGVLLSVLTVSSLVYTVIESPHWGWGSARSTGGFALAAVLLFVFVKWELSRDEPLLDVSFFRSARFSAATSGIGIAFFCLFGFTFLVTQYFQFVRGYDTLSAGLHTLPFAIGAGVTAPFAARAALRFGTKRVVALGLLNMAIGFTIVSQVSATSAYWGPVIISMLFMANGLSLVTSPSTDAVMGSLPRDKAGVGSAVNDISREVGGTLGVAVVGSVFVSLWTPGIESRFGAVKGLVSALPAGVYDAARESVGAAYMVAERAPVQAQPVVRQAVSDAFMHGFGRATLVAAGMAVLGAVSAVLFLPDRPDAEVK